MHELNKQANRERTRAHKPGISSLVCHLVAWPLLSFIPMIFFLTSFAVMVWVSETGSVRTGMYSSFGKLQEMP